MIRKIRAKLVLHSRFESKSAFFAAELDRPSR